MSVAQFSGKTVRVTSPNRASTRLLTQPPSGYETSGVDTTGVMVMLNLGPNRSGLGTKLATSGMLRKGAGVVGGRVRSRSRAPI